MDQPAQPPPFASQAPTQEDQEATSKQREVLARAGNLLASADFRWFLRDCLEVKFNEAQRDALDMKKKTPQEREIAGHIREAILDIKQWVEKRRDVAADHINSLER